MSTNSDKVKGTINNLCSKYHKTSWKNILPAVFESDDFDTAIHQLVCDVQAGQPFTPLIKDMFKSFDLCPLEDVKVVFINANPSAVASENDGLAFSSHPNPFNEALDNIQEGFSNYLGYLPENGVLLLNMALTCPVGKSKDHIPMWEPIARTIIHQIAYQTVKTVFVFVGEEVEHLAQQVTKNHLKLFIPSFKEGGKQWDSIEVFQRINLLLTNAKKEPVNW